MLNADGTFENESGSCTITTKEKGTYTFTGGTLTFKILKYLGTHPGEENWVDLSDATTRRQFFGYKDDEKDVSPRTEFNLTSIRWGERKYLMNERELSSFVSAINFGLEPRDGGIQPSFYGKFLLREGDEEKSTTGKPVLPPKYMDLLLSQPILATIVSMEEKGEKRTATIDKGRLAGVKPGMIFISQDQVPDFCCKQAIVLSVDDTSSKIEALDWLVGEPLTTRLVRKSRIDDPF